MEKPNELHKFCIQIENGSALTTIKRAQNKVPCKGDVPTNEELIRYIVERVKEKAIKKE